MSLKKFLPAAALASCLCAASCLKNDNTPTNTKPPQDPSLELKTIDSFANAMGYYNMRYDQNLAGFKYEIIDQGDTVNAKLTSSKPVGVIKYIGKMMNGVAFDSSYKMTDSSTTFDFSRIQVISAWQYVLTYSGSKIKIGKGGHIRFITPSKYAYGAYANGPIPANSPLFFDIYLKDVKAY